jgi:hypothetical protein
MLQDDEITHFTFLNAYLQAKGASAANLDQFRTLQGSTATGSSGKPRLTNLMQLTLDTSWYTRYRDAFHNPDLDPNLKTPQAVKGLSQRQFTAIPRTDADLTLTPTSRPSRIRRRSTCRPSNRVATASIHLWRKEPTA